MKTTRQRIIQILQENRSASANELSRAIHTTAANIRHHLGVLEDEGVVEIHATQAKPARGRPVQRYSLIRQISAHNLDGLASALFQELANSQVGVAKTELMKRLAHHLVAGATTDPNPTRRLYSGMQLLNEMNYQARWEARREGPLIIFAHCPYAAILPDHPEICQMDAFLLEEIIGGQANLTARLELTSQGWPQCMFLLAQR